MRMHERPCVEHLALFFPLRLLRTLSHDQHIECCTLQLEPSRRPLEAFKPQAGSVLEMSITPLHGGV